MGGVLFKKVATIARLRKRDFMQPDKVPRTYDQRPFQLDGRMDLSIEFNGTTMTTPVYIKMDAHDQLLLSEGVCRQLGIVTTTQASNDGEEEGSNQPANTTPLDATSQDVQRSSGNSPPDQDHEAVVPTVRINLLQSTHILPHQSKVVEVALCDGHDASGSFFLESSTRDSGLQVDPSLLQVQACPGSHF